MSDPLTCEIAVVGGGPVGLTLALALARDGADVVLIDAEIGDAEAGGAGQGARSDARAYFIAHGCWRIWTRLGVGEPLLAHAQAVRSLTADGEAVEGAAFDDLALGGEPLGWMIEHAPLMSVLRAAVGAQTGIRSVAPAVVDAMQAAPGAARLTTDRGEVRAGLVAACDGGRSSLRESAGIAFEGRDYPALALSLFAKLDRPMEGVARQLFLPTGPIAVLPLPGDRANIVWTMRTPAAHALSAMSTGDLAAELRSRAGDFIGGFKLEPRRGVFPLKLRLAGRYHAPRLALVGDSAHLVHPLAGQGLNLGLKDAAALADVVRAATRRGLDPGSETALEGYTRARRADGVAVAAAMDAFARVFTAPSLVRALGGLALGATRWTPGLMDWFVREAGGAAGDAPALMRPIEADAPDVAAS